MPQRTLSVLWMLLGLLAVVGLVLLGRDIYRHARTGPRWKRRLIGAGLAVLGMLGVVPPESTCAGEARPAVRVSASQPEMGLDQSADWRTVLDAWTEAMPLAVSGESTTKQRTSAQAKLKEAEAAIQRLAAGGLLTEAEAGLLTREADNLYQDIYRNPPADSTIECYKMMLVLPAKQSVDRLSQRLPMLEKLMADEMLHPGACAKVLAAVEGDLAVLAREQELKPLPAEQRAAAEKLRDELKPRIAALRERLGLKASVSPLEETAEWQVVLETWKLVTPLAESGQSTTAQRQAAQAKLAEAKTAIANLAERGLLFGSEAGLLASEADRLQQQMLRNQPTDVQVKCYEMGMILPAEQSFQRLKQRLPLLEKLAADGTLHPVALAKVLPAVEADIQVLSDPNQKTSTPREQLDATRDAVKAQVEKLKASLAEMP